MSKYTSLSMLFAFAVLFFIGCGEKKDATTFASSVRKIDGNFIVFSVEDIQDTNLSKIIVMEENHNEWRLCLVAPKQSLLKVDTGKKVEVVFIGYFSDKKLIKKVVKFSKRLTSAFFFS